MPEDRKLLIHVEHDSIGGTVRIVNEMSGRHLLEIRCSTPAMSRHLEILKMACDLASAYVRLALTEHL